MQRLKIEWSWKRQLAVLDQVYKCELHILQANISVHSVKHFKHDCYLKLINIPCIVCHTYMFYVKLQV